MKKLSSSIGLSIVLAGILAGVLWYTGNGLTLFQAGGVFVVVLVSSLAGGGR